MIHPTTQGHSAKLVRIRPYRPSDSEQVQELYKTGLVNEPTSVIQLAYNAQLKAPTACVSYSAFILGLALATFQTSPRIRHIGLALCIAGCALFVSLRFVFPYMALRNATRTFHSELKDIRKTFGMEPVVGHNGERTGEYVPTGKSGFWVAEAYEKGSEIGDSRTEIVGSIGLYANKSDETSVELRRMVVSQHYRRRGIAISLIKTALRHAQNHGVRSVVLTTTVFQPAAIAMYEKFGWVLQKKISVRIILLDRLWLLCYSLDLTNVKL